jgi:hypothetical protein
VLKVFTGYIHPPNITINCLDYSTQIQLAAISIVIPTVAKKLQFAYVQGTGFANKDNHLIPTDIRKSPNEAKATNVSLCATGEINLKGSSGLVKTIL